jgi:DNA-binding SARP family transcriptional activator/Tfp pilus assembly protein PilF
MIELRTLGTIDLLGSDALRVEALLRRPKRLALLAYLAIERPAGRQRRDSLLALFWPEADGVRARAALRQALHVIREALGDDALEGVGDDEVSLSPAALRCDAVEFARATAEGRPDDALALYRGDLLPGLFIRGAAEFDQWLDDKRQRLRGQALRVAGDVADRALAADDLVAAAAAARRAVEIGPEDEPANRRLMAVLDHSGDRAGALEAFDELARRMREAFDAAPSAETRELAKAVRSRERADPRVVATALLNHRPTPEDASRSADPIVADRPMPHRHHHRSLAAACLVVTAFLSGGSPLPQRLGASSPGATAGPGSGGGPRRPIPPGARDAFERGLHYLDKPNETNLGLAVRLFEQACDSEPLYAAAWAGLGNSFLQLGYWNYLAPGESFPKAIAAANEAIHLDPSLPDPYVTLGFARMYYDRDWSGAEAAFRRAIALDSTYAPAHERYAYLLTVTGRPNEARAEIERARHLAPLSLAIAVDAGFVHFYGGRLREARTQLDGVLARDSLSPGAHLWLGRVNQREGKLDNALREYGATGPLRQWVPTIAGVGYVRALRGERDQGRRALTVLDSIGRDHYVTAYAYGLLYAALGDRDSAFVWLDRAVAERTNWIVWLALDNRWAPLRGDPRFAKVLERAGLAGR